MISCQDYDTLYSDSGVKVNKSDSTILGYLSESDTILNFRFDSMMVVINGIPGLKDSLEKAGVDYTVMAIPNECFQTAIKNLNDYRQTHSLGEGIYLKDLLIEPFIVKDTIIKVINATTKDTTIVSTVYDYRKDLESLLCRYIFRGIYDFNMISSNSGGLSVDCYKYEYMMNMKCGHYAASGVLNGGVKYFIFSDRNNTQLMDSWIKSKIERIDLHVKNGLIHVLSTGHEFGFDDFISQFKNYGNERK